MTDGHGEMAWLMDDPMALIEGHALIEWAMAMYMAVHTIWPLPSLNARERVVCLYLASHATTLEKRDDGTNRLRPRACPVHPIQADQLGLTPGGLSAALKSLVERGRIEKVAPHLYRLSPSLFTSQGRKAV